MPPTRKKYRPILKVDEVQDLLDKNLKQCFDLFKEMSKTMKEHKEFLEKIALSNEAVEDTLLNVLLAIRQNEYLQAWYPKQGAHSEMKVTGHHPGSSFTHKKNHKKVEDQHVY